MRAGSCEGGCGKEEEEWCRSLGRRKKHPKMKTNWNEEEMIWPRNSEGEKDPSSYKRAVFRRFQVNWRKGG